MIPALPSLSIVVPLYNEEENVPVLQSEIEHAMQGLNYEIVFVDDASTDRTASVVRVSDEVVLVRFKNNEGQSAAMLAGMRAARGETIVLMDGDLQNDPLDIPKLLNALNSGADLACGYRVRRADSLSKKITSRVANFVRSRVVGDGIRDTGCTLKAMRRECVAALVPFRGMHRFIPALIKNAGFRIVEVPVSHRPRRFGVSKYGLGNRAVRATTDMLGVAWLQNRRLTYEVIRTSGR
ncbi:MAG: glycosyltransferase family 2 protein [Chthoniobacterales bacterium]